MTAAADPHDDVDILSLFQLSRQVALVELHATPTKHDPGQPYTSVISRGRRGRARGFFGKEGVAGLALGGAHFGEGSYAVLEGSQGACEHAVLGDTDRPKHTHRVCILRDGEGSGGGVRGGGEGDRGCRQRKWETISHAATCRPAPPGHPR